MSIKEKLKILQDQGLSLKFLANLCGIKSSLIYKWHSSGANLSEEKNKILNQTIEQLYILSTTNEKASTSISYEDISNQKFNHLTALYPVGATKDGRMQWACQCDCGNPILKITTASCLKKGETISCGCQRSKNGGRNFIDLTNQKFGKLLVIERGPNTKNDNRVQWKCKCDCGKECLIRSHDLLSKKVYSCGCSSSSQGELEIEQILQKNNISYIKEYSFDDLISPKNKKLRFDFAIFDKIGNLIKLIEFDGKQHFEEGHFKETKEDFEYRQKCDQIKEQYCFKKNLPLKRIPYTKLGSINLKELIL